MQYDVTFNRNVSNRRFFKLSHRLYCENTAIVDFVARIFSRFRFRVSGCQSSTFTGGHSPDLELLAKYEQIEGHTHKTLETANHKPSRRLKLQSRSLKPVT
jgi:hypothetical protein